VQRPRDVLTARMQRRVEQELAECDGVLFVVDGAQGVGGPGDRWIAQALAGNGGGTPVTIVVNKVDRLDRPQTVLALQAAAELDAEFGLDADVFPVSAHRGIGVRPLVDHIVAQLPEGPFFFGEDEVTDLREEVWLAEMVREQVLRRTRQEVPHAVEVQVEEIDERDDLVTVRAAIWTETESQKGILIGAGGRMVREIGTAARKEIEREIAKRVHLDLTVRVRRSWRADDALLDRLGIT
jgi:GTP-binding protein Era